MKSLAPLALVIALCHAVALGGQAAPPEPDVWAVAARNATQAHEAFARCNRLVHAWYKHKGNGNFLVPQNLRSRVWNGHNSAADLWSFFVLTAHLTDQEVLGSLVRQTLSDDVRLATRVGWLTDDFDIDKNRFTRKEPSLPHLIMTNSEYVKDGLLPIVELTGHTVWFDRARGLIEGICENAPVETKFGSIPSTNAELNGEMLQNLSRFYCATRDERYKQWAFRIADAYFLDALPKCNDLPCHSWDFANGRPASDRLSLSDHGNEIIFGLSEAMVLAHHYDKTRGPKYVAAMKRMVDKLLAIAVNEHGLFMRGIQPSTGKVTSRSVPDTWGYSLDGVYALHMVTGETKYRDAVHRALRGINADPKYRNWGGSDAFADSIESGIVLLNRIPEPEGFEWLKATVKPFLAKQRPDGIVEGWHGDGNYARTALMYALMKTAGTRVEPWRPDLKFGAVVRDGKLYVQVTAAKPWKGTLLFDYPRHRFHFGLPLNYPRLNEYPEWFPMHPDASFEVTIDAETSTPAPGWRYLRGVKVQVNGKPVRIVVQSRPDAKIEHLGYPQPQTGDVSSLLRAAGVRAEPMHANFAISGAVAKGRLRLTASWGYAWPWRGRLYFDYPRCQLPLGQRAKRPRRSADGAWYAVSPCRLYQVTVGGKAREPVLGDELLRGLQVQLPKGTTVVDVEPLPGPPYGGKAIFLDAPPAVGGDGTVRIPITVRNETGEPQTVRLATTFGSVAPAELKLAVGAVGKAVVSGELTKDGAATITATPSAARPSSRRVRLVHDRNLAGFQAFDDQEYKGTPYLWCGRAPIEFTFPARPGKPHTLHLFWGSKGDERKAKVTLNGKSREVSQGGYDGFKWLILPIEPDLVKGDTLKVRVERLGEVGAAFISQAKLTSP